MTTTITDVDLYEIIDALLDDIRAQQESNVEATISYLALLALARTDVATTLGRRVYAAEESFRASRGIAAGQPTPELLPTTYLRDPARGQRYLAAIEAAAHAGPESAQATASALALVGNSNQIMFLLLARTAAAFEDQTVPATAAPRRP